MHLSKKKSANRARKSCKISHLKKKKKKREKKRGNAGKKKTNAAITKSEKHSSIQKQNHAPVTKTKKEANLNSSLVHTEKQGGGCCYCSIVAVATGGDTTK